jgi:hypothetical protein
MTGGEWAVIEPRSPNPPGRKGGAAVRRSTAGATSSTRRPAHHETMIYLAIIAVMARRLT